jgi:hypothetical protein
MAVKKTMQGGAAHESSKIPHGHVSNGGNEMKFTDTDKAYLIQIGNGERHLPQIEDATQVVRFTMNGRRISSKRAIKEIGRKEFLSAMSRCAYHQTASRRTPTDDAIDFEVPDSFWE